MLFCGSPNSSIKSFSSWASGAPAGSLYSTFVSASGYKEATIEPTKADMRLLPVVLIRNLSSSCLMFLGDTAKAPSELLEMSTTSGGIGEQRESSSYQIEACPFSILQGCYFEI